MSIKNGLQDTFADWKYNNGSVCVIDVSRDIGLEPDEDVGQAYCIGLKMGTEKVNPIVVF